MRDWHKIAANYRPMVGDVLHPDECVVIRIMGAEWRVRPLQLPRGIRYTPEFGDGVEFKQTIDPLGNEPMQAKAKALVEFAASEPEGLELVSAVCDYLSALLDQQYDISDEAKGDLLGFRGEIAPLWIEQALRHANGLPPFPTAMELVGQVQDIKEPPQKPWWKFWIK